MYDPVFTHPGYTGHIRDPPKPLTLKGGEMNEIPIRGPPTTAVGADNVSNKRGSVVFSKLLMELLLKLHFLFYDSRENIRLAIRPRAKCVGFNLYPVNLQKSLQFRVEVLVIAAHPAYKNIMITKQCCILSRGS